jgi:hypothetical protein
MNKLLARLRLRARIPALVLLLAILTPLLITALPASVMSAEQQLLTDIAASYCAGNGNHQQQGDQTPSADHHQCCILCATPGHVLAAADATPIIEKALIRLKQPEQQTALRIILEDSPALEWASPRGPPTQPSA